MKRIINRCKKILSEPKMLGIYIKSKLSKQRLYKQYSQSCARKGVQGRMFILSFDCDTLKDSEVIIDIINKLKVLRITPVLAVPGELLIQGSEQYKSALELGAQFINHGYKTHSIKTKDGYASVFDYYNISNEKVIEDIIKGHTAIKEVLGIEPKGFRTPHFGNFQKKKQFNLLYRTLKELKYDYSTSTIPYFAFEYGAVIEHDGILEVPVTGLVTEPLRVYDSFMFYDNERDCLNGSQYKSEGAQLVEFYKNHVENGIINIYVDPSQVYKNNEFFETMGLIREISENVTYDRLIKNQKEQ